MGNPLLVTVTENRPEAFAMCERWVKNQFSVGTYNWLVIDQGRDHVQPTMGQQVILSQREPKAKPFNPLEHIDVLGDSDEFIFIPDTDYIGPSYIFNVRQFLFRAPVVGERGPKHYDLSKGEYCQRSARNSQPFLAAIKRSAIPEKGKVKDADFWAFWGKEAELYHDVPARMRVCMEGAFKIKRPSNYTYTPDTSLAMLKLWTGYDYGAYLKFLPEGICSEEKAATTETT